MVVQETDSKAAKLRMTIEKRLPCDETGHVSVQGLRKLLVGTLSDDEFEAMTWDLPKSAEGLVPLDVFVGSLVEGRRPEAAGSGVAAARQLKKGEEKKQSSGSESSGNTRLPQDIQRKVSISPRCDNKSSCADFSPFSDEPQVRRQHSCVSLAPSNEKAQTVWAEPTPLDRSLLREFLELDQHGKVQAEYVWLDALYTSDGHTFDLCSKSLTLNSAPKSVDDLPIWSYGGEDHDEAIEVVMVPRKMYKDPFRRGNNIIVLADLYMPPREGVDEDHCGPVRWNSRAECDAVMQRAVAIGEEPWFGLEQEYYLLDAKTNWPLGWPLDGFPGPQGNYFCATGAAKAIGRDIVEAHYRACLFAGVCIGGTNSEIAPGQWEFQVGPCVGTDAADDLWMARFLLQRICEMFVVNLTFTPKPVPNWAGIGGHTNYSTTSTRGADGWNVIQSHMEKLRVKHLEHMAAYGSDNELRLVGNDETQRFDRFSWGVGDRSSSIRVPVKTSARGCGYYEDRRPAANMDPYLVTKTLVSTTLFHDERGEQIPPSMDATLAVDKSGHRVQDLHPPHRNRSKPFVRSNSGGMSGIGA